MLVCCIYRSSDIKSMSAKLILGTYVSWKAIIFLPYTVMNYHVRQCNNAEVNLKREKLLRVQKYTILQWSSACRSIDTSSLKKKSFATCPHAKWFTFMLGIPNMAQIMYLDIHSARYTLHFLHPQWSSRSVTNWLVKTFDKVYAATHIQLIVSNSIVTNIAYPWN